MMPSTRDPKKMHEKLRKTLVYSKSTGEFTTIVDTTRRAAGDIVGTLRRDGTYIVTFDNKLYTASRLAYFWMKGVWPIAPVTLKKKKRVMSDYRWDNLNFSI